MFVGENCRFSGLSEREDEQLIPGFRGTTLYAAPRNGQWAGIRQQGEKLGSSFSVERKYKDQQYKASPERQNSRGHCNCHSLLS